MKLDELITTLPGYDPYRDAEGFTFHADYAQAVIDLVETNLHHVEGPHVGKPMILPDWVRAYVANVFGWMDGDGLRRYREVLVYVPRKNIKSTSGAIMVNIGFFTANIGGAQIISAASETKQAGLIFNLAKSMMATSPQLSRLVDMQKYEIRKKADPLSVYRYVTSNPDSLHGTNPYIASVDELHVCPEDMITALRTGQGAQQEPLLIYYTTADYDRESICNRTFDYALKVRDGILTNPRFLPVLYFGTEKEDWTDPANWAQWNPMYGQSVKASFLKEVCQRAIDDPTYENEFKRLYCNIRTGQKDRMIPMHKYDACNDAENPHEWRERVEVEKGKCPCFGGLDIGSVSDLTALKLVFPEKDGGLTELGWYWVCEARASRKEKENRESYLAWARSGWINMTHGDVTDYDQVERDIKAISERFRIVKLAIDYTYQAAQLTHHLDQLGLPMETAPGGMKPMTPPTRRYLELILEGKFRHGGNPVSRWMASNASARVGDCDLMMPSKRDSGDKIDGVVASIYAVDMWMRFETKAGKKKINMGFA